MTEEQTKEYVLDGLLAESARSNLGVYCQNWILADGTRKERGPYEDGWNAAVGALLDYEILLSRWYDVLPDTVKVVIPDLLADEKVGVRIRKKDDQKECHLYVNCSDLFYWACSDLEDISLEELPDLLECLRLSPDHGELLWCCRKRGMRPQRPYYESFNETERELFDAAGPKRDPGSEG